MTRTIALSLAALSLLTATSLSAQEAAGYVEDRIQDLLDRRYDYKLISSGQNFPSVKVQRDNRGELIVLLHDRIPVSSIQDHFGWSDQDMTRRLNELVGAGLLHRTAEGDHVPTVLVMSIGDVARYMPVPDALVAETAELIREQLPAIRRRYMEIRGFQNLSFETASFLLLSDVLLDNWQINAIEREFLRAKRPLRAGSRYYYSIQEASAVDSREAFGIYGNQYRGYGDVTVGVYGNRRNDNPMNFQMLDGDDIERLFSVRVESVARYKADLLSRVVAVPVGGVTLNADERSGFEQLGWIRDGDLAVPVLDGRDDEALSDMAAAITADLVATLESYRPVVTEAYETSPYADEVSFEEYFMWWYHLFYTAVTDRLIAQGAIPQPKSGITTYLLVRD